MCCSKSDCDIIICWFASVMLLMFGIDSTRDYVVHNRSFRMFVWFYSLGRFCGPALTIACIFVSVVVVHTHQVSVVQFCCWHFSIGCCSSVMWFVFCCVLVLFGFACSLFIKVTALLVIGCCTCLCGLMYLCDYVVAKSLKRLFSFLHNACICVCTLVLVCCVPAVLQTVLLHCFCCEAWRFLADVVRRCVVP